MRLYISPMDAFFFLLTILYFKSTPLSIILFYHNYIFSIVKESHFSYPFTEALIIYLKRVNIYTPFRQKVNRSAYWFSL